MGFEGRYNIVKKVADGGMAEIFLATQTGAQGFERTVILKRILPAFSGDPHFRNMIVDEAHIAMSLNHGGIVQVLDLGESRGRTFLVLELVDGWDLATVRARAQAANLPLPVGLALYVVAEVCRALAYAHGKTRDGKPLGIVHRDISPQNVLASEQGEIKLTDFGIAKALGKRERTQTGVIKGKLDFMSPEQASGAVLDARSDIFSVGTLLYVMATGKKPFEGGSELDALLRLQSAQFSPPEEVKPDIDPKVAAIIAKAMQKAPSKRYRSAEEMMRAVEDVLRTDFASTGQSELKRYLEELGRRDKTPTIARAPGMPVDPQDEEETSPEGKQTLALASTRMGAAPEAGRRGLDQSTARIPWRTRTVLRAAGGLAVAVALAVVVGGVLTVVAPGTAREWLEEGKRHLPGADPSAKRKRETVARSKDPRAETREAAGKPEADRSEVDKPARTENKPAAPTAPAERPDPAAQPAGPGAPPAQVRPARPSMVTLLIKSRPAGATVRNRKGSVIGKAPVSLSLRPGTAQRVTVSKRGYSTATRTIETGSSDKTVTVTLTRAKRTARR